MRKLTERIGQILQVSQRPLDFTVLRRLFVGRAIEDEEAGVDEGIEPSSVLQLALDTSLMASDSGVVLASPSPVCHNAAYLRDESESSLKHLRASTRITLAIMSSRNS
ncbi:MAG: hypothetical protein OSB10_09395, partial [Planctomycetota bacterium]|nr:hypothetical protein [Planctomycetota bacterium]